MTVSSGVISADLPKIAGSYENYDFSFVEVDAPGARVVEGLKYPFVLKLTITPHKTTAAETADPYEELAKFVYDLSHGYDVFAKLTRKYGVLAFKGFGSVDPQKFSLFINSLAKGSDLKEFLQNGIAHPRKDVAANVTTVNKSTGFKRLYAHQELSRFKTYPSILAFFCKYPSETGGDETLTHAGELLSALKVKYPEVVDDMKKKGVYLTQTWPLALPLPDGLVYSWAAEHSFGRLIKPGDDLATKKEKAGKICKEFVCEDYEWTEDDGMKLNEHTKPIRIHPYTKKPILFSSLPGYYQKYKWDIEHKDPTLEPYIKYDDGSLIPQEALEYLLEQSMELAYEHKFEQGDIVLVDNYLSYHGRTKYGEQRREILASFWDDVPAKKKNPEYFA